jgi:hypothetical protein
MDREQFYSRRSAYRRWQHEGGRRGFHDDSATTSAAFRAGERGAYVNLGSPLDGLTPREARAVMAHAPLEHERLGPVRYLPRAWTVPMQTRYWVAQTNVKRDQFERRHPAPRVSQPKRDRPVLLSRVDAALIETFAPMSALHKHCFQEKAA